MMVAPSEDERLKRSKRVERQADQLRELEDPICNVSSMTELCLIAADHAGTEYPGVAESECLKVTKENWALLKFALYELQDKAHELKTAFYADDETAN